MAAETGLMGLCQQYGGWGIITALSTGIGILWAWSGKLHRELRESHNREVAMAEKILPLVEALKVIMQQVAP